MADNKLSDRAEGGRQSNMEACRIVSMFLIVLLHTTYGVFGYPETFDRDGLLVFLFSSVSIYAVDVFILLSGYFGIRPKKKSIARLLSICLFAAVCKIIADSFSSTFDYHNLFFLSRSNWYVVSYLGLVILSPVLNTYIERTSRRQLAGLTVAFYCYSVYFSVFPNQAAIEPGFHSGCSVIWFAEVYLIGRYLKLYGIPHFLLKHSALLLAVSVAAIFFGQVILAGAGYGSRIGRWGAQNQPFVLLAALSMFTLFTKINIRSGFINHIAQSALTVLLLHNWLIESGVFVHIHLKYSDNLPLCAFLWIAGVCVIYIICTLVDQIRIAIYKPLIEKHLI